MWFDIILVQKIAITHSGECGISANNGILLWGEQPTEDFAISFSP